MAPSDPRSDTFGAFFETAKMEDTPKSKATVSGEKSKMQQTLQRPRLMHGARRWKSRRHRQKQIAVKKVEECKAAGQAAVSSSQCQPAEEKKKAAAEAAAKARCLAIEGGKAAAEAAAE
eukprot:7317388-Ditylum_brightwellii.AAC.1